ncbi:MAG: biopolymer transporter ExbD [Chitinophagaceae bacterium]
MAVLNESTTPVGRRKGFGRMKKHNLKTDMTPMVDLGFLLIAFFIFTTRLSEPVVVRLAMPRNGDGTKVGDSKALTILLDDKDKVWYYHGNMNDAIANKRILQTSFSLTEGIGKIIRDKQEWLDKANISDEKRNGLMLLIKATDKANYENVMNALDEALINEVKKYALIKPGPEELNYINTQTP